MLLNKKGKVLSIFIAPPVGTNPPPAGGYSSFNQMIEIKKADLVQGMGIVGDRWFGVEKFQLKDGTLKNFSHKRHVSFFSVEDFLKIKNIFIDVKVINLRRNILLENIEINNMNKIKINNVIFKFSGYCRACQHIEKVNNLPGLAKALYDIGGIRAEVLSSGTIKKNDEVIFL